MRVFFFFFKQKTAYEMRISDWSSDVCSSDLAGVVAYSALYWVPASPLPDVMPWGVVAQGIIFGTSYALLAMGLILIYRTTRIVNFAYGAMGAMPGSLTVRSEEHTSELQSLMRITYSVLRLINKKPH